GVALFMLAPLAVSPLFLYAWTGESGLSSRWAFAALMIGAAANVVALPAATIAQATGRAGIQARAAVVSMLINIPLSVSLVLAWGLVGGAIATAIAMLVGSWLLIVDIHRLHGWPLAATGRLIAAFWPSVAVC